MFNNIQNSLFSSLFFFIYLIGYVNITEKRKWRFSEPLEIVLMFFCLFVCFLTFKNCKLWKSYFWMCPGLFSMLQKREIFGNSMNVYKKKKKIEEHPTKMFHKTFHDWCINTVFVQHLENVIKAWKRSINITVRMFFS